MDLEVTRDEIEAASGRIAPHVRRTPLFDLGDVFGDGYRLSLKLDSFQPTGSFKVRGAFSLLTAREIPARGVTAASGGNFGAAVAYAARSLGLEATIFVPETSPVEKLNRISEAGAELRVIPGYYDEALAACHAFTSETGAFQAHAYDQKEVVAGQGTVAREIMEDAEDASRVLVAVGGGGLIGGVASWCRDDVAVVSVEPERCPSMRAALDNGGPIEAEVGGVAASSLGARSIGQHAWYASKWINGAVLVTDQDVVDAQRWLWKEVRIAAEPAAATTVAGLMAGVAEVEAGEHVVALISGANFDPSTLT